jgi:hypothetical protein
MLAGQPKASGNDTTRARRNLGIVLLARLRCRGRSGDALGVGTDITARRRDRNDGATHHVACLSDNGFTVALSVPSRGKYAARLRLAKLASLTSTQVGLL